MSELWSATVLAKKNTTIEIELRQVHADAGPFPRGPVFALRLLFDEARELDENYRARPCGPLAEAITFDELLDDDTARRRVSEFIREVEIDVVRPSRDGAALTDGRLPGLARYRIEVTAPSWIAHLRYGQCWDSAAFL